MKVFIKLIVLLLLCLISEWSVAQNDKIVQQTIKLPLSDGIHLSTEIFQPDSTGRYPVILIRTPYGKYQMGDYGNYFARHGYVTVVQDVRGKFDSEGEYAPFLDEKKDGLEVLDWIAKQPWCDGQIAGFGTSYIGFTALTVMDAQHPALKAVFNTSGWIKPGKMNNPGGALHLGLALPWLLHEETEKKRNLANYDLDSLYWVIPLQNAMQAAGVSSPAWGSKSAYMNLNADFDFSKVNIPVFHVTGWYDFVKEGTIENYLEIARQSKAPQKLLVGPWFHNQEHTSLTEVGEEDFGKASYLGDPGIRALALRWFDYWLKGKKNGIMDEPMVEIFNMFHNEWEAFETFPPKNIQKTAFYLSSQKGANSLHGDGWLTTISKKQNAIDTFSYHPLNPVPTNGGANFHFFPEQLGIKDQRDIEKRMDVLVYTSDPFTEAKNVIGRVQVKLFAASEGEDTDFTAKLVLVDKSGYARNICDGIIRARHHNGLDKNDLLMPKKVYEFDIDLGHTAFQIQAGQRIRLEISSSNFPKFDRNLNVATDSFEASEWKTVKQTIYHSKKYPSQLILPILQK